MSKRRENGYNVLQNKLTNTTINGVTFTINEDKSVTLNGTATNSIITNLITGKYDDNNATNPLIIPENITNYRLSGCPSGGSGSTYKLDIYNKDNILIGTDFGEGIDISKNSGGISSLARVRIIVYSGAVLNNVTFYPMISYGTEEKPYEEYGAMPSLDYPSEVRAVGDNVNILPNEAVSESKLGVSLTVNSNGSLYLKGTATDNASFQLKGNYNSSVEVFRFKANTIYKNVSNINIRYRKINNGDYVSISPGQIFSYSSDVVVQYLYIEILKGTTVDKTYYPKIIEYYESVDESYSPYGQGSVEIKKYTANQPDVMYQRYEEQSLVLDIQKPMLSGDYFDLERGKEVHHFNKYISTLEDTWVLTSDEKNRFRLDGNIADSLNTKKQYCSHSSKYEVWATQDKTFSVKSNTNKTSSIYFNSSQFHTAEEFNQFVAEQEEAGTPLTFWYEVEEYELDLTEEQKSVLQQLSELELFKGTNNIITAESLALMQMSYIVDTQSYIDKQIDEKLANINQQILELAGGN